MTDLPQITDAPRGFRVAWVYGGVWGILAKGFLVPEEPPVLPSLTGEPIRSFRPAPRFLTYLLLPSLVGFGVVSTILIAVAIGVAFAEPAIGLVILGAALPVIAFWGMVLVLAIHLRYDTTWYVLSDRSLRIRRGIWTIRETTITFENVQNVTVRQGPLQRFFGIADVLVETAGGGGGGGAHGQQASLAPMHQGLIEGIAEAPAIRDLLTAKMRASKSAGLGDEAATGSKRQVPDWGEEHIAALREIREAAVALAGAL